ncbi:hypothetical protein BpHYR1_031417 [Brachionus plicatilis]|uniref:Uncharacterized protein n=1 Tax=Brachionus plicatilis TaxID=10195 RepID=A0A3M7RGU9_BRAPC|nr:hypothetical protein BpHYR1_031417 [Brachionus plicatilis]
MILVIRNRTKFCVTQMFFLIEGSICKHSQILVSKNKCVSWRFYASLLEILKQTSYLKKVWWKNFKIVLNMETIEINFKTYLNPYDSKNEKKKTFSTFKNDVNYESLRLFFTHEAFGCSSNSDDRCDLIKELYHCEAMAYLDEHREL